MSAGEVAASRDPCPDAGDNEITENPSEVMTAVITNTSRALSPLAPTLAPASGAGRSVNGRTPSAHMRRALRPGFSSSFHSLPLFSTPHCRYCSRL